MTSPRMLSFTVILILAAGTVWILKKGDDITPEPSATPVLRALRRAPMEGSPSPARPAPVPFTPAEFTALKERLAALDAEWDGKPPVPPELLKLTGELVDRAPFSPEMSEILDMDAEGTLHHMAGLLRDVMADRLKEPGSATLRLHLVEHIRDHPNGGFYPVEEWLPSAGAGCDSREFQTLAEAVKNPGLALLLEAGYLPALARTQPAEAVRCAMGRGDGVIEQLRAGRVDSPQITVFSVGYLTPTMLSRVIDSLPPETDFRGIADQVLMNSEVYNRDSFRQQLAVKWGEVDPAASAAWILDHQKQVPVWAVPRMVQYFDQGKPDAFIAWVRAFPPGRYYDAAALHGIALHGISRPVEFREILSRVQNPDVHRGAIGNVEPVEVNVKAEAE